MFPLWDIAIAPVLSAARVRRIVEIGALRGENTVQILEALGPDAELHVIDPVPAFDPNEHEKRFPGQYVFHEALSLDILPALGPVDAALIDGDHNWYTVFHELRMLAETAEGAGTLLPVIVMHDVGWPYGRRDLYYNPSDIPDSDRQPYRQGGMRPGRRELLASGGLNPTMYNADFEGGPHNGVMTALDDFMAAYPKPLRLVVLPIYFGLAILVEEERIRRQPAVADVLDRLESKVGQHELLELAEDLRLRAMIFQHNVFYKRTQELDRANARYLDVMKGALLDEHYLENEVRIAHLNEALYARRPAAVERVRDPNRYDRDTYQRLLRQRRQGVVSGDPALASVLPFATLGRHRLDHLQQCLDDVRKDELAGDLVEYGTGRGGAAIFMRAHLQAYEDADRKVWVADRFRASPEPDLEPSIGPDGALHIQADVNMVRDGFDRFDLLDDKVRFLQGPPEATLPDAQVGPIALLRVGESAGDDTATVLELLYDRVAVGGHVIVDGCEDPARRASVEQFRKARGIGSALEQVDLSAVTWRKAAGEVAATIQADPVVGAPRAPLAPPLPTEPVDLSIVVVFYNMAREAPRTLRSLSRWYQEGLEGVSYEVIAVDNGSSPDQRLTPDMVAAFGPEFRLIDLAGSSTPSPAPALNHGIRASRLGRAVALMIDGAHMLTPGVLRYGLAGLSTYAPAIVATQQWYLGPGQQGDAMDDGYDQAAEDRLLNQVDWPANGYRLFEIANFVGDRDWFDGVWESNCMFVPRSVIEQIGGFDESFDQAGGGYANLDLYERLGSSADLNVVTILGEGSFHQVHGGTTTNQPDAVERRSRVFSYGRHFSEVRGRKFRGPGKPIHYVGRINSPAARRSKARRLSAEAFAPPPGSIDGPPTEPTPVPQELKDAFTEAVWLNMAWQQTRWLGEGVEVPPTDLVAYQELIERVRPDWIVVTGGRTGGRARFLASICDLVGHGTVVTVDPEGPATPLDHPRIRTLTGTSRDRRTAEAVKEITGEPANALVFLGSRTDRHSTQVEFEAYAPLVPVGSYVVVEQSIVNGHPVWPSFGPGPGEAIKQILTRHGNFVADPLMERYSLTFNPSGYLRRVE